MADTIRVAKSYQGLEVIAKPYEVNGKEYVKVRLKNGTIKAVRNYSEAEYRKYNPEVKIIQKAKTQKEMLGFGKEGYIWLFKGNTYDALDWFREQPTKYNNYFGWHLSSEIEMPSPLPAGIKPVKLFWDNIKNPSDEDTMMDIDLVKKYVETLVYDAGNSEWVGEVGDKVTVDVTCLKAINFLSAYGENTLYSFIDKDENMYSWTTSTNPGIMVDNSYNITGKIKKLDIYRNNKVTVLTRVKVNYVNDWDSM